MPAGTRIRSNNVYGSTTDNPLTAGATSYNSAELILMPNIAVGEHTVVVLDPKRVNGQPEIVIVTAHTGLSTTATITRAAYGTVARSHPVGTLWAHVAVDEDYVEVLTSTTLPADPYEGQSIYETDIQSHRHYNGAIWNSAPPVGTLLSYLGSTAPTGYLFANGAAVSRTGVTADLFAVIGETYGVGDGVTTYNLPNLNGRVPVGRDAGQIEFDVLGEIGGVKTVTITTAQMPVHTHNISDPSHSHTASTGIQSANHNHTGIVLGTNNTSHTHGQGSGADTWSEGPDNDTSSGIANTSIQKASPDHTHGVTVNSGSTGITTFGAGSGSAHNNLQPYLTVNFIIKL